MEKTSCERVTSRRRKKIYLPDMPLYETATIQDLRVNKYSTIMVDSCQYSVPDNFVDRMLRCKVYTNKILFLIMKRKYVSMIK